MGPGSGITCSLNLNTVLTPQQCELYQNAEIIRTLLSSAKTIAIVGCSTIPQKASNMVASYLQDEGYRIIPVNPSAKELLGEKCYASLIDIPVQVDIVDIFRPSHELAGLIEDAIKIRAKAVWMQLRIINLVAADRAICAGLQIVIDKCIKMEHGRFSGGLHSAGMNTGIISARRGEGGFRK